MNENILVVTGERYQVGTRLLSDVDRGRNSRGGTDPDGEIIADLERLKNFCAEADDHGSATNANRARDFLGRLRNLWSRDDRDNGPLV